MRISEYKKVDNFADIEAQLDCEVMYVGRRLRGKRNFTKWLPRLLLGAHFPM